MSAPWRRTDVIKTAKIPLAITHAAAELDILSLEDSPARVSEKNPLILFILHVKTILYQILMSVPLASMSVIRLVQIRRVPTLADVSWGTHWMLMDALAMVSCVVNFMVKHNNYIVRFRYQ